MQHELCFCAIYSPAIGVRWFLEQPSQSCLDDQPRFQDMLQWIQAFGTRNAWLSVQFLACVSGRVRRCGPVWGTRWRMGIYGSPSAKPHKAWSNNPALLRDIHNRAGHISKAEMQSIKEAKKDELVKVAEKSNGKRAHSGQKQALQNSQLLAWYCKNHGCGCLFAWHACLSLVLDT